MGTTKCDRVSARIRKKQAEFLQKFADMGGIVASTCKAVGITRSTFYEWLDKYPYFKEKAEDVLELQKDMCEATILKKIKEGDTTMIIFYAKTKMKDRGYVEKKEVTVNDRAALVDLSKLSEEQRRTLLSISEQVFDAE